MGLQELLLHLHPTFGVFVVPLCMAGSLALLPYIRDSVLRRILVRRNGKLPVGSTSCPGNRPRSGRRRALHRTDDIGRVNRRTHHLDHPRDSPSRRLYRAAGHMVSCLPHQAQMRQGTEPYGIVLSVFGTAAGLTIIGIWFRARNVADLALYK